MSAVFVAGSVRVEPLRGGSTSPTAVTSSRQHTVLSFFLTYASCSSSGDRQAAANRWLNETFQRSAEGWLISVQLLAHRDSSIAFFASRGLTSRVRTQWSALSADQQAAVLGAMASFLQAVLAGTVSPTRLVLDGFSQAMACAALASGGATLTGYFSHAVTLAAGALGNASASGAAKTAAVGMSLLLLKSIGGEAFSRACRHRAAAAAAASANAVSIMQLFEVAACGKATPVLDPAAAAAGAAGVDPRLPLSAAMLASVAPTPLAQDALLAATAYTAGSTGLTLGAAQQHCPGLLAAAVSVLGLGIGSGDSSSSETAVAAAADFIISLVGEAARDLEATVAAAALAPVATAAEAESAASLAGTATLPPGTARPGSNRPGGVAGAVAASDIDLAAAVAGAGGASAAARQLASRQAAGGAQLSAPAVRWTLLGFHSLVSGLAALAPRFKRLVLASGGAGALSGAGAGVIAGGPGGLAGAGASPLAAAADASAVGIPSDAGLREAIVHGIARVCTAIVAAAPGLVAGSGSIAAAAIGLDSASWGPALEGACSSLLETLLQCAQYPCMAIMEVADEAWPHIAALPLPRRTPACGPPLFARVLERLLRGATLPDAFPESGDWEAWEAAQEAEADVDGDADGDSAAAGAAAGVSAGAAAVSAGEPVVRVTGGLGGEPLCKDTFDAFRSDVAAPALECCFRELRGAFLEYTGELLAASARGEGAWTATEVVLFTTKAAARGITSALQQSRGGALLGAVAAAAKASAAAGGAGVAAAPSASPAVRDHETMTAFLSALFSAIGSRAPAFTACTPVVVAAASCIHAFAGWLVGRPTLVDGCLRFAADALRVGAASASAAGALRQLLPRNAARLAVSDPAFVTSAIAGFRAARESKSLTDDDAAPAAAALVRAVSALTPPAAAAAALQALLSACTLHCAAALADGERLTALQATMRAASAAAAASSPSEGPARASLFDQIASDRGLDASASGAGAASPAAAAAASREATAARRMLDKASEAVAGELRILTSAAGILDAAAVPTLLGSAWPTITGLVTLLGADEAIVAGATGFIAAAISAAKDGGPSLLKDLLGYVLTLHAARPSPACLECIGAAVEAHGSALQAAGSCSGASADATAAGGAGSSSAAAGGGAGGPDNAALAAMLTACLTQGLAPVFVLTDADAFAAARDAAPLLGGAFTLATTYVLHCPMLLLASPAAGQLLGLAQEALEANPMESALATPLLGFAARFLFLASPLLSGGPRAAATIAKFGVHPSQYMALRGAVDAVAAAHVPALVPTLIAVTAAGDIAADNVDGVAEALLSALVGYPAIAKAPLEEAIAAVPDSEGAVTTDVAAGLTPEVCAAIASKLLSVAAVSVGSPGSDATSPFRELVADLYAVWRGNKPLADLHRDYGGAMAMAATAAAAGAAGAAGAGERLYGSFIRASGR